jgi:hypothetical protein
MPNDPSSELPPRQTIFSLPPPKKGSPYACAQISTDRPTVSDAAFAVTAPSRKRTSKYSRTLSENSQLTNESFELIGLRIGPIVIGAETFVGVSGFEPVVPPCTSPPLFFEPVQPTSKDDETAYAQSTFTIDPPKVQNFYNSYGIAKPYVRKSEAPAYYSKPGNRSDVSFGTKQRQQFFGRS